MRITRKDQDIITSVIKHSIADASVYLFGSRVDDNRKGGDIDIFLDTSESVNMMKKLSILRQFEKEGIQRKVDLIIQTPEHRKTVIFQEVQQKGIRLC